jgi:hypothetical protein
MHLNKGHPWKKHCFITKMSHHSLHLPHPYVVSDPCMTTFDSFFSKVTKLGNDYKMVYVLGLVEDE